MFSIKGIGIFFTLTIEEASSSDSSLFGLGCKAQALKLCQAFVDAETSSTYEV